MPSLPSVVVISGASVLVVSDTSVVVTSGSDGSEIGKSQS